MIQRMVASAVFAGFAAGLIAAALQFVFVEPLLLRAELYETGRLVHVSGAPELHGPRANEATETGVVGPATGAAAGQDQDVAEPFDAKRTALTVLFMALTYVGYALLLVAFYGFAESRGARITPRAGLLWGLAGFVALMLAPAAGLAPELPGMTAADLAPRQIWWVATAIATAAGLWLIAFGKTPVVWAAAAALILAPHLIGAPHPAQVFGAVPPELAAAFVGRTLAVGMAGWVLLGLLLARFRQGAHD